MTPELNRAISAECAYRLLRFLLTGQCEALHPHHAEIVAAYREGTKVAWICKNFKISYKGLKKTLVRAGVKLRKG